MGIPINIIATVNNGRFAINQNERYSYQARGAKIIWLSEPIDVIPDDNKIYEVKYPSGKLFEGIVSQVGQDEIVFSHYNCFLKEMERRNIDCISSDNCKDDNLNPKQLRQQWINTFAKNIDISKIYIEQHLWHVFSYKRIKCFEKEEANKRFNNIRKDSIYIFFDYSDTCYLLKNAEYLILEDIKCYQHNDIYITDIDFTWTYVITHEDRWLGPYFYSI